MARTLTRLIEATQTWSDTPSDAALTAARRLIDTLGGAEPRAELAPDNGVSLYWGIPLDGPIGGAYIDAEGKIKKLFYCDAVSTATAPVREKRYGADERLIGWLRKMIAGTRPWDLQWFAHTIPADAFRVDKQSGARIGLR